MFLASALIEVRRLDEATAITDAFEVGGPRPEGITEVLRARIALAAGRLDDAVALAESASRRVKVTVRVNIPYPGSDPDGPLKHPRAGRRSDAVADRLRLATHRSQLATRRMHRARRP